MILTLLTFLGANASTACPQLAGTYECRGTYLQITQESLENRAMRYHFHYYYKRDGKRIEFNFLANANGIFNKSYKLYGQCRENELYTIPTRGVFADGNKNYIGYMKHFFIESTDYGSTPYECVPTKATWIKKLFY